MLEKANPRKVSDGGGQFSSNQAMDVYTALGMKKEQIEKRQVWKNYIESHFNIVRRYERIRLLNS